MPIKWTTWKKWTNIRKVQSYKTEPGRNRKYEQTNHSNENETEIKNLTTDKIPGGDSFRGEFYQNIAEGGKLPN